MKLLIFDIIGKFAHFRKYYSNSSALSFGAPPRTTICGMVAAILGMEKDSYYSIMNLEKCKIAVSCKNPIRKTIHKLNYLYIKSVNDLNASYGNPTQVPFEVVSAPYLGRKNIKYRIFFSHKDESLFHEFQNRLKNHENKFSLSLGAANFTAYYKFIDELEPIILDEKNILISSLVPINKIDDYLFDNNQGKTYLTEMLPLQFNDNRELISLKEILYCDNGEPLILKMKEPVYSVHYKNSSEVENIVFME